MNTVLNRQEVAEAALIKFFRKMGVFAPPKALYDGEKQDLRIDMLIHATAQFITQKGHDPRRTVQLLAAELQEQTKYL